MPFDGSDFDEYHTDNVGDEFQAITPDTVVVGAFLRGATVMTDDGVTLAFMLHTQLGDGTIVAHLWPADLLEKVAWRVVLSDVTQPEGGTP